MGSAICIIELGLREGFPSLLVQWSNCIFTSHAQLVGAISDKFPMLRVQVGQVVWLLQT
jgi:hypothetical protein